MELTDHVVEKVQQETGERMLELFRSDHLPQSKRAMAQGFDLTAVRIVTGYQSGPERTVCLRKLLEAKDAGLRCAVAG